MPTPTFTPDPTDTPLATPTPMPGWKKFTGKSIELWLPESYEGGDVKQDLEVIVESVRRLGPDFEQTAQMIEQNPALFALWAFDSEVGESGFLTNVNVGQERIFSAITIDIYLDVMVAKLPGAWRVTEREIVSLDRYQAGRIVTQFTVYGTSGKQLVYAIKHDNTMWIITYSTHTDEYDQRLPVFEQSARTFVIQPEP